MSEQQQLLNCNEMIYSDSDQVGVRTEWITPKKAREYLDNQNINRKVSQLEINKMVVNMQKGLWVQESAPIIFDYEGKLIDGQHRMHAVIKSGIGQWFIVLFNYSKEAMSVLDIGKCRSAANVGQVKGLNINHRHTACVSALELPEKGVSNFSKSLIVEYFIRFEEGVRFAVDNSSGGEKMPSPLCGLLAKAYYYEDRDALFNFMIVFGSGMASGEHEWAAIALRNYCQKMRQEQAFYMTWQRRIDLYLRCQNALTHFLAREAIRNVHKPRSTVNLYPLPGICEENSINGRRLKYCRI